MMWPFSLILVNRLTPILWKRMCANTGTTSCVEQSSGEASRALCNAWKGVFACMWSKTSACHFWTGNLRADRGGETTHRWPQSGQKGTSHTPPWCCIERTCSISLGLYFTAWCCYLCCQVYYEPMLKLDIMTESELGQIFGTLDSLIPLHQGELSVLNTFR